MNCKSLCVIDAVKTEDPLPSSVASSIVYHAFTCFLFYALERTIFIRKREATNCALSAYDAVRGKSDSNGDYAMTLLQMKVIGAAKEL